MSVVALPPRELAPPHGSRGWLERWLLASEVQRSPEIFRLWAGIGAISAAAQRRVWTEGLSSRPLYPNLFIFLVSPPGVGKSSALDTAHDLLRLAGFHAPNDVTKQSLLDFLAERGKVDIGDSRGGTLEFSFAGLFISEMSAFMHEYSPELAGLLTQLYDCGPIYEETRRVSAAAGAIVAPGLSLALATSIKNLGDTIPHSLWGQGFMTRVLMVYSDEPVLRSAFGTYEAAHGERVPRTPESAWKTLRADLERISELRGPLVWDFAAQCALDDWMRGERFAPVPTHPRLAEYNTRRWMQVTKLAMISALSDLRMHVQVCDVSRAQRWLFEIEARLPILFDGAYISADSVTLDEFVEWARAEYAKARRALPAAALINWLRKRAGASGAARLLDLAERAGLIDREAGTSGLMAKFVPKPRGASA